MVARTVLEVVVVAEDHDDLVRNAVAVLTALGAVDEQYGSHCRRRLFVTDVTAQDDAERAGMIALVRHLHRPVREPGGWWCVYGCDSPWPCETAAIVYDDLERAAPAEASS